MTKLLRWAGAVSLACALFAAGPVLAGSPFYGDPNVAVSVGEALGPNYDLWAWVSANVVPWIDQAVVWLVGIVVTYAGVKLRAWFGIAIPAKLEETIRQTALTGAHLAIAKAEGAIDDADLVDKAKGWVRDREPAAIKRLGLSDEVLGAIALKMVKAALAGARGPAGPAGPAGPVGPQGPAGASAA